MSACLCEITPLFVQFAYENGSTDTDLQILAQKFVQNRSMHFGFAFSRFFTYTFLKYKNIILRTNIPYLLGT